ncbi:MAG: sulfatase [Planctomycetes bacterium]|nr:sulfatase [Planctomycetota bacterium]
MRPRTRWVACLLAAAALAGCGGDDGASTEGDSGVAETAPAKHPNVLIWLVDTLRADHLSTYGYERETSPNLTAMAGRGVLFEQAFVHSNWTQPSVTSLLSGCYPPTFSDRFTSVVPEGLVMAPEWFGEHGYSTAGMTVTMATAERYGFGRGFRVYEELDAREDPGARKLRKGPAFDADKLVDAVAQWFDHRWESDKPFFVYLHSVDPHAPYESHPDVFPSYAGPYDGPIDGGAQTIQDALNSGYDFTDADKQHMQDLYDDEVRFNDHELGALFDVLRERGLLDDTLVVFVADHGEEFWDRRTHGHGHRNLFAELTHTPLVLSWPDGLPHGARIDGLMRGIDLFPTLVELAGLPPVPGTDGSSLASIVRAGGSLAGRDTVHYAHRAKVDFDVMSIRTPELFYQADPDGITTGLYDLARDPDAHVDVRGKDPDLEKKLQTKLLEWTKYRNQRDAEWAKGRHEIEIDAQQEDELRAMGYLGGEKQPGATGADGKPKSAGEPKGGVESKAGAAQPKDGGELDDDGC